VDTGEEDEDSAPPKRQKGLVNSNGPRELNRMGSRDFSMPCWNRMIPRCLHTPEYVHRHCQKAVAGTCKKARRFSLTGPSCNASPQNQPQRVTSPARAALTHQDADVRRCVSAAFEKTRSRSAPGSYGKIGRLTPIRGKQLLVSNPRINTLSDWSLRRGGSLLSHLAAISTFFRLGGLPPNQTPIGLGPSGGHPIKISTSGAPHIGLGSLGGCPAYKLPTCRQGDPLWALNQ
jgi:hypothetical protein